MNEEIIYTMKRKYFPTNVFTENWLCDVTLVSDDQKPFQAHRYILSFFSPVLKNILLNNPHSHPLVYLRGVNFQELDSILQLIYFGKTSVHHSNFKSFAQAAKDLQIKKLAEDIISYHIPTDTRNDVDNNYDPVNESIREQNENKADNEYSERSSSNHADNIIIGIPPEPRNNVDNNYCEYTERNTSIYTDKIKNYQQGFSKQLYKCEECDISYKNRDGLSYHTKSRHEGIYYSCKYCGYKFARRTHLKTHEESIHEGVKYACDHCEYKATRQCTLKKHIESLHLGVKYSCDHCDFQAKWKSILQKHINSVHEGVKITDTMEQEREASL